MSGRVPARLRRAIATALGLGLAVAARTQEKGSAEGGPVASRDAIAEAKSDFDKIKSARDAALLPDGRLPRIAVPELSMPTAPSPTVALQNKIPSREPKPANWLVDAVEKQGSSRDGKGLDSRSRDRRNLANTQSEAELPEADRGARKLAESDESRERRDQRDTPKSKPVVFNPLTAYLGDWMTPQDYSLLKPGLGTDPETGTAAKSLAASGAPGVVLPTGGITDFSFGIANAPAKTFPPARENPYLQSLKPESPGAMEVKSVISPPVAIMPRAPVTAAPPQPVPTPKIPDFARPSEDDRYFKQLKRF